MSLPSYPGYKESGREVLEVVPSSWNLLQLRRLEPMVESGTSVNALDNAPSPGQPSVLKTSCVYTGKFRAEECKQIVEEEIDRASCPVKRASLIVSRMNTPELVGAAGLAESDMETLFLPDRLWQVRLGKVVSNFAYYWTQSGLYRDQVKSACSGTSSSMQNLTQENFLSFYLPLPSQEEQRCIASFLYRETAKIDALIAEQQRLIELLQEKRQAVISHAVTKGLNPDAPMKDSGVEWLGEVPEHWEVIRLKYLTQDIDGVQMGPFGALLIDLESQDTGYKVYGQENVIKQNLELGSRWISKARFQELERYTLRIGDIAVTRKGSLGNALLIQSMPQPGIGDSDTIRIRCAEERLHPSFLVRLLHEADYINQQLIQLKRGSVLPGLNTETIRGLVVAVPQLHEQEELLSSINEICEEIYRLASQATATESLLKERRSALISAAVTGQIDVRGLVEVEVGEQ